MLFFMYVDAKAGIVMLKRNWMVQNTQLKQRSVTRKRIGFILQR